MLKQIKRSINQFRLGIKTGIAEYFYGISFEVIISDVRIIAIEVPFMTLLGCGYHLQLSREESKTGWYKDGKFLTERM